MYNFNLCELLRDELTRRGVKCDYTHGEMRWRWFYYKNDAIGSVEVYDNVAVYVNIYDIGKHVKFDANDPDLICNIVKIFNLPQSE